MARFTGVLGILAVLLAAWLFSTDRKRIRWRTIFWGLGLQITFAFLVLRFGLGRDAMSWSLNWACGRESVGDTEHTLAGEFLLETSQKE